MYRLLLSLICCLVASPVYSSIAFYVGEESYAFERQRDGGTHQDGVINGVRIALERFKSSGWYLGADYLYAAGHLSGSTGRGSHLTSDLSDQIVEVRLGYMLQQRLARRCPYFIPYGGWGYFREVNDFISPSPLPCRFTDTFNFVSVGFLSGVNFTPMLSMGFNFKVRFMLDGESAISNDPQLANIRLQMENETHYRVELPFTVTPCDSLCNSGLQLVPFYEFRHFGGREGFPFDFRDTKFQLYGLRLAITRGY